MNVYLDNQATTRADPRVVEVMLPYFTQEYGNASSRSHDLGRRAAEAVEHARGQVAELIGAAPREIVFTSGATESNNLALKGATSMLRNRGGHIVTVVTEHKAVLDPCRRLESWGLRITYLPVDSNGLIEMGRLEESLTDETVLVSVMAANNEIGVLQPIGEIGQLCKARGILFHTDAAQAVGKVPIDVEASGIDLLSISGHKMYGPKGIGALYVRSRNPHVRLEPQIEGGGHERGMRSGTLPVPLIVGLGEACRLCGEEMGAESERQLRLRNQLLEGIIGQLEGVRLNGHPHRRLPGNLNLTFSGVRADALMAAMPDIAVSATSACTSASGKPSYVLRAIGLTEAEAECSIRIGLGRFTSREEIAYTIERIVATVKRLRAENPSFAIESCS